MDQVDELNKEEDNFRLSNAADIHASFLQQEVQQQPTSENKTDASTNPEENKS